MTLKTIGLPMASIVNHDGSGLSYDDRVTASFLVQLLTTMTCRPEAGAYYQSLAVAGEDGTLRERMRGTAAQGNAHAKTGTLNIAVSLSGYVLSANRRSVGYSILVNGDAVSWTRATKAQDAIDGAARRRQPSGHAAPEPSRPRLAPPGASVRAR